MSVIYRKGAYYPGTTQNKITTSTSVVTGVFSSSTSIIRVAVQYDTYVNPVNSTSTTATVNSMIISGGRAEFFAVNPSTYLACLQVSTSGWISVTELASTTAVTSGS
jgi:hypothetical protein